MEPPLDPLSLTRKLLAFNTINPPGQEYNCVKYLGKILENGGFKTNFYEFEEGRKNLVARLEGRYNKLPICFTGHIDTVPLGAAQWSKDPFKGEVEDDKIYGRGSTDMKGGIAAMVIACLHLAELSNGTAGITLIITVSEETGCQGAQHLAQSGNVLEKGGALIVGEPTSNYPLIGHKGALFLEAQTRGIAAHGSMPEKGVNAIYKAAQAVSKLEKFDFNFLPHPIFGPPTLNVGTITGGVNINSVPDQASIGIDIRTVPGQSNKDVYETLLSYLGENVEFKCLTDAEPVSTNPKHEWIQKVFEIMETFIEERPVPRVASYFTDASALTPALGNPPTIILGPGEPEMAHKTDEFCYISKIEEATEAYVEIGRKWCGF